MQYGGALDKQSQRNYDNRKADNVLKEFESKTPEEMAAARASWDKQAAITGGKTFDQLIQERFNDGDTVDHRVAALARGDHAEAKAYALREGMKSNDQKEIEDALTNPDLSSPDPAKKSAALAEKQRLADKSRQLDQAEQQAGAVLTGRDPTKIEGRGVDQQLAAHYQQYVETDELSADPLKAADMLVRRDHYRAKREEKAQDDAIATTELLSGGKLSTATEYHRGW
jgi:hypothetical protein